MATAHNLQAVVTALSKTFAVLVKPHFLSCENILSYYPGILHSCHMSFCQLCVPLTRMYVLCFRCLPKLWKLLLLLLPLLLLLGECLIKYLTYLASTYRKKWSCGGRCYNQHASPECGTNQVADSGQPFQGCAVVELYSHNSKSQAHFFNPLFTCWNTP